jgi:hypothetical protein
MTIRETLEQHQGAVKIAISLVVLVSIVMIFTELRGDRPNYDVSRAGKDFFSEDDGATWFLADGLKGSPFNDNGATAYRAMVFRCGSGQPFIAYLAKYSDDQIRRWHAEAAVSGGQTRVAGETPKLLKKPGDSAWKAAPPGLEYPPVSCPDGQDTAIRVNIFDPGSGAK